MDALATRYANPAWILDGFIRTGRLYEFLKEFSRLRQEAQNWDFFLHKIFGESWDDFQRRISTPVEKFDLEATIMESQKITMGFNPPGEKGGAMHESV